MKYILQNRATPDEILKNIEVEQNMQGRGHLKIFFGYAAGVGKTYAMLKAAHIAIEQGLDVVGGYIEPHTRPQTMELLKGIDCLDPLKVRHKDIVLNEFDLDEALERKPQLVLVDELAHTNAVGCRHEKRYQDIEELLNAGIDVFTTVNVQHIESLNDIVASITGVLVRERIPDRVFDNAYQVELVDIEPQELIIRLNEGKIYNPNQAQKALGNFFSVENLTALREIALRRTADRVNKISEKRKQLSNNEYYTDENILVCISSSPSNAKIIRAGARMAAALKGEFTALFVETPNFSSLSEENKTQLRKNLHLAQHLGAKIETVCGEDIAFQIAEYARFSGVSKIVVGRSNTKRNFWFPKYSFAEKLTEFAPNLDIYIIPDRETPVYKPPRKNIKFERPTVMDIIKATVILILATVIGYGFYLVGFSETNIITIYILGVLITAVLTSNKLCSIASSVLSVLVFNFFFTEPRYSLVAYDPGYPVTFLIMFAAAVLTSSLALKIKRQAKQSAATAYRTKVLLDTNLLLQQQSSNDDMIDVTVKQLIKLLKKDIVFYKVKDNRLLPPFVQFCSEDTIQKDRYTTSHEQAVATWVFKNNKHAGATTGTLGSASCLYLAVRVKTAVHGVVGIALDTGERLEAFENSLVLSILGECALALEKDLFRRTQEEAVTHAKNEQLRANLLRSISHDLRTPLTSISGNAGVLLSNSLEEGKKQQLYTDIYDDSMWLINLVENLLSVTRIEDGTMQIHMQAELIEEIIFEALRHVNRKSEEYKIIVEPIEDIILVKVDSQLIIQVIMNIVDNAIKYTPVGSTITIGAKKQGDMVQIEIADDGTGISDESKDKIFDMFYTANNKIADSRRGLGLGLALCQSIIIAHKGKISVADNYPNGTVFKFTLQAQEVDLVE